MSSKHLFLPLLLAAATAHADPVADFRAGTTLVVRVATIDLGGSRTNTNIILSKQAGTLDFDLRAADLGVKAAITVHLRGVSLGGGTIRYAAKQTYSPAIDLGGGHWVSSVSGSFDVHALPMPGTSGTQQGNVRLVNVGEGSVVATGDWGALTTPITHLDLTGGVPQPALEKLVLQSSALVCSDRVATKRAVTLTLAGPAQSNGATVLLESSGSGLRVPSGFSVPKGKPSISFDAIVEPNFVGTVQLKAAAGGVTRSLEIAIHSHGDCR